MANGRTQTRQELSTAALRLFAEHGYSATTVDQIACAAGVARRTFFRYFPTKEDAIFPDHDSTVVTVGEVLRRASLDEDPLVVVCRGIREVLRMYAADPVASVARYRLLREVPTLREREIAVVSRYERLFTKYLLAHPSTQERAGGDGSLLAEVAAAAVVAAHNHVLRSWLRSGGIGDVGARLEVALTAVRETFLKRRSGLDGHDVIVTVARSGSTVDEVVDAVRGALSLRSGWAPDRRRRRDEGSW
ncbi:MAG TPA: TetR family transcriptional regulator [Stackebrandtia sp.]|uniref:TetR family transcriptional regulator n=1 Tax=Stackebrandtia sp. TaxID=2023065 RepID=UPI002D36DFFF|nr:TetR family transcriptional regulator [Stackebrandtia sp.]HZE41913.1 TetR family transcriptional regulator [Stackebrandtia sp.]